MSDFSPFDLERQLDAFINSFKAQITAARAKAGSLDNGEYLKPDYADDLDDALTEILGGSYPLKMLSDRWANGEYHTPPADKHRLDAIQERTDEARFPDEDR